MRKFLVVSVALSFVMLAVSATAGTGRSSHEPVPLFCRGKLVTIPGTAGDDVLSGTDGDDVMHGLAGERHTVGRRRRRPHLRRTRQRLAQGR